MLDQKAFLLSYGGAIVPAMLKDNREEEIKEMAALLGLSPVLLICCCWKPFQIDVMLAG